MRMETMLRNLVIFSRVCAKGRGEISRAACAQLDGLLKICVSPGRFQTREAVRSGTLGSGQQMEALVVFELLWWLRPGKSVPSLLVVFRFLCLGNRREWFVVRQNLVGFVWDS